MPKYFIEVWRATKKSKDAELFFTYESEFIPLVGDELMWGNERHVFEVLTRRQVIISDSKSKIVLFVNRLT